MVVWCTQDMANFLQLGIVQNVNQTHPQSVNPENLAYPQETHVIISFFFFFFFFFSKNFSLSIDDLPLKLGEINFKP
jgi:hypothetical protein